MDGAHRHVGSSPRLRRRHRDVGHCAERLHRSRGQALRRRVSRHDLFLGGRNPVDRRRGFSDAARRRVLSTRRGCNRRDSRRRWRLRGRRRERRPDLGAQGWSLGPRVTRADWSRRSRSAAGGDDSTERLRNVSGRGHDDAPRPGGADTLVFLRRDRMDPAPRGHASRLETRPPCTIWCPSAAAFSRRATPAAAQRPGAPTMAENGVWFRRHPVRIPEERWYESPRRATRRCCS